MATKVEFAAVIAYISAGCQKPLSEASLDVYFDLLGDLPAEALMVAAKRVILDHKYATFPPVAAIREFAVDSMAGEVKAMAGAEAWGLAMAQINRIDVESDGSRERHMAKLPEIVHHAVCEFGFMSLYNLPNSQVETARAQFCKLFDAIAERAKKTGLLPAPVQQQVSALGDRSEVKRIAYSIGKEKF